MKHYAQTRWALIFANGQINHGHMAFSRRAVIEAVVKEYWKYVL
jgi:hypothetical protein